MEELHKQIPTRTTLIVEADGMVSGRDPAANAANPPPLKLLAQVLGM
jgi:hypothetical protein